MPVYIYDGARGMMVDRATGEPMLSDEERARALATPMSFGDIAGYASPVTGEWIDGRRAKRYDLEKHDCIDANEFGRKPKKLKNERFVKKHGLQHLT